MDCLYRTTMVVVPDELPINQRVNMSNKDLHEWMKKHDIEIMKNETGFKYEAWQWMHETMDENGICKHKVIARHNQYHVLLDKLRVIMLNQKRDDELYNELKAKEMNNE